MSSDPPSYDVSDPPPYDVVVPTAGRDSLGDLLRALGAGDGTLPGRVLVIDDRSGDAPLELGSPASALRDRIEVVPGPARGPAAARNVGWRSSAAEWVAFLDDDVVTPEGWRRALVGDLAGLPERVAGSQGRIVVPRPRGRRPTDWERNTAALEGARWATADMAYRRTALAEVGGFDERFGRAYREDADLGLRLVDRGYEIARGTRHVIHPVRPADRWVSVRLQAGNADDVLMRALHGPGWRQRAAAPRGRLPAHLATTAAALAGTGALAAGRRRVAALASSGWLAATADLAWRRIAPGPRTLGEVATMLVTSALIPPVASAHWARGHARRRRLLRAEAGAEPPRLGGSGRQPLRPGARPRSAPRAVLLDRDGTLVEDVPYNGDPELVTTMPGAEGALERLRRAGVRLAVVSNQSGVGRGVISEEQVHAVNRRVEELLGPLGPWLVCPHAPDEGCACRKPAPGLVLRAAELLGVEPERCAVVGDIGADVEAARAAGARAILVPTPRTRPEEVAAAPETAPDLESAVERLLAGVPPVGRATPRQGVGR